MTRKRSIFRQAALERLSSPEQLDQLMTVTTPRGWLALLALFGLLVLAVVWGFCGRIPIRVAGQGMLIGVGGVSDVVSPFEGQMSEVHFEVGEAVEQGQVVARISQDDAEPPECLRSPFTGRVLEVKVDEGSVVDRGTPILSLELVGEIAGATELEAVVYISPADGKRVRVGSDVQIFPWTVRREEAVYVKGRVTSVGEFPATRQGMFRTLGSEELVQALLAEGGTMSPIEIHVDLGQERGEYTWSNESNAGIQTGTPCYAYIIIDEKSPVELVWPAQ
jgi:hypothetical protein